MTEPKKIWIVNYYSAPPDLAFNPRHIKFGRALMDKGYDVTIVTSSYLRRHNRQLIEGKAKYRMDTYGGLKYIHVKALEYSGNGLRRMLSIFGFAIRLFRLGNRLGSPDIIYHNIHMPFDYPVTKLAKRLGARYIVEAWDLWPHAFVRHGLASRWNPAMALAYRLEYLSYKRAESIIFTMEGGADYLAERGLTTESGGTIDRCKVHHLNNGVDLAEFDGNTKAMAFPDSDLDDENSFKVLYVGSIRQVNKVGLLIEAARLLLEANENIRILIYGDGPERPALLELVKAQGISNVVFKDRWLPFAKIPYVLSKGSINAMNYGENFGGYGISAGKFFLYLAAGKPVVCNVESRYCLIQKHRLGVARQFRDAREYADAVLELKNLPSDEYQMMCKRARDTAETHDYRVLAERLSQIIERKPLNTRCRIWI